MLLHRDRGLAYHRCITGKNRVFAEAGRLEERSVAFALAFITEANGSVPRNSGRMLIRIDGSSIGSMGGGAVEALALQEAAEALRTEKSRTTRRSLTSKGEALSE